MQGYNDFGQLVWSSRDEDSAHRGRDRRGIRAGNLVKECVPDNDLSNPRVEVPLAITKGKTFRTVDGAEVADRLTAADQALWHYLVARAKSDINALAKVGSDAGLRDREAYRGEARAHQVTVGDMLAYLGDKNPARLRDSLDRIGETQARYDIRYRRTRLTRPVHYIAIHPMPEKLRSRDVISYEIDPEVRVCMLLSRKYVTVDLNALSKFKCRYSARLFVKLSGMAARHAALLNGKKNKAGEVGLNGRHWAVKPEALAEVLGYPMQSFRTATFTSVMTKVVADLEALPSLNKRFESVAAFPTERLPSFVFATTEARKSVFDADRAWLDGKAFYHASAHTRPGIRKSIKLLDHQCVHHVRVGQAQAYSGFDGLKISTAWRSDVEAANAREALEIVGWPAAEFLQKIDRFGADAVFESWLTRKAAVWSIPEPKLEPAAVPEHEAVIYDNDDEDDIRIGDELGDLDVYAEAA